MTRFLSLKSIGILSFLIFFNFDFSYSQSVNPYTGEPVKYCSQHTKHAELMQNPQYAQQYALDQQTLLEEEELLKNSEPTRGTIYKIPVVFHVLHNGGEENISREQILDALRIMNRDWRKQNEDTSSVLPEFQSIISDIEIEFVLATKAPNGACFSGITRTQSPLSLDGSDGNAQVTAIIDGNDVYNAQWPGNNYLNIFVCKEIGGAAGYTTKPSNFGGTSMYNEIWVLQDYVGSIGTSDENSSRTLTHEAGHWLNLSHTWGNTNEPGLASNCDTDDGVTDTPNTRGSTSCNLNENFCGPKANVQNYMDYSYCSHMFTEGQKTKIRTAVVSSIGGRNNLWTPANLTATGADGNLTLCKADFTSSKTTVCVGEEVNFTDVSYNRVTSWNWSLPGSSAGTSTEQNPTVTYAVPGIYDVVLAVTDGSTNLTSTKTGYIRVLSTSEPIPFFDGFENYSTLVNNTKWQVINPQNNQTFAINTTTSLTGTKCVKIDNFNQATGSEDELVATPLDLSTVTSTSGVTLSFRYSYRKRSASNNEKLQVYASNDCGVTWSLVKNLSGTILGTIVTTNAWTPSNNASDWVTVHVTNIGSTYWVENFNYKFKFTSSGGNNIYLENINVYPGGSSETIVYLDSDNDGQTNDTDTDDDNDGVDDSTDGLPYDSTETVDTDGDGTGNNADTDDDNDGLLDVNDPFPLDPNTSVSINETVGLSSKFAIMPNPTDNDFMLEYNSTLYEQTTIEIIDPLGKIVQKQEVNSTPGNNLVFISTENYSSGIYLVKLNLNGQTGFKRLLIK